MALMQIWLSIILHPIYRLGPTMFKIGGKLSKVGFSGGQRLYLEIIIIIEKNLTTKRVDTNVYTKI